MTVWWLLVAVPAAGVGVERLRARRRAARTRPPERVAAAALGLKQFPAGGALVQFSIPARRRGSPLTGSPRRSPTTRA